MFAEYNYSIYLLDNIILPLMLTDNVSFAYCSF